MNSMPAASKAALTSSNVDERLGGTLSTASNLLIVLAVTPDLFANSSVVQRRAFLAERIWVLAGWLAVGKILSGRMATALLRVDTKTKGLVFTHQLDFCFR